MTDDRRIDLVLAYALALAGHEEPSVALAPIHLVKYTYIADLAYAERHGSATFTGVPWTFHYFGPWAVPVYVRIAPVVADVRAVEQRYEYPGTDERVRYLLRDVDPQRLEERLPADVCSALKRAIRTHGADTASLLQAVYLTAPMLRAAPGDVLDFAPDHVAEAPADTDPQAAPASKRAVREHRDRVRAVRARVRERLAARRAARATTPPPRYDDVFVEGQAWLNSLAGEPLADGEVALVVDENVWRTRGGREPTVS